MIKQCYSSFPLPTFNVACRKRSRTNCMRLGGKANMLFKVQQLTAATSLVYCIELHTHGSAYMKSASSLQESLGTMPHKPCIWNVKRNLITPQIGLTNEDVAASVVTDRQMERLPSTIPFRVHALRVD